MGRGDGEAGFVAQPVEDGGVKLFGGGLCLRQGGVDDLRLPRDQPVAECHLAGIGLVHAQPVTALNRLDAGQAAGGGLLPGVERKPVLQDRRILHRVHHAGL